MTIFRIDYCFLFWKEWFPVVLFILYDHKTQEMGV